MAGRLRTIWSRGMPHFGQKSVSKPMTSRCIGQVNEPVLFRAAVITDSGKRAFTNSKASTTLSSSDSDSVCWFKSAARWRADPFSERRQVSLELFNLFQGNQVAFENSPFSTIQESRLRCELNRGPSSVHSFELPHNLNEHCERLHVGGQEPTSADAGAF